VIAPSRSATGHAMLFINPHLPFFGPGQVYEAHIHSDEGGDFTGYARFGFPFPYIGHNLNIGWVSTDNSADSVDGYVEHFEIGVSSGRGNQSLDHCQSNRGGSSINTAAPFDPFPVPVGSLRRMDAEQTIAEIEWLERIFAEPDTRPLSATGLSTATQRHEKTCA
jgi:hypothetical protein